MSRRFEVRGVEDHGRRVAIVFDNATGKTYKVHRRGSRVLNWANDTRVEIPGLRRVAKEALS